MGTKTVRKQWEVEKIKSISGKSSSKTVALAKKNLAV